MNLVSGAVRVATGAGEAATATLGAIGGAAVGGLVGSVKGAAAGASEGARRGSHSTPAAVLTMGAVAATGVVQWPIVAAIGGTALVLDQLKPSPTRQEKPGIRDETAHAGAASTAAASAGAASETKAPAPVPVEAPQRTPAKSATKRRTAAKTPSRTTP